MPLTDDQLAGWFKREGFRNPKLTVKAMREANIQPETAAALLSMESGDGSNVWGHDKDGHGCIPPCGGEVTEANYRAYKQRRLRDGRMQGCGPVQLTWHAYQDEADRAGGCWKPYPNMLTGFRVLRRQFDANRRNLWSAFKLYNGSADYATRAVQKRQEYVQKLNAFKPEEPSVPRPKDAPKDLPEKWFDHWRRPWLPKARRSVGFRHWLGRHGYLTPHFTKAEAASKDGRRIPKQLIPAARNHAFRLERLRHELGDKALPIVSWYRSPEHNVAVGGARFSKHMAAIATDLTQAWVVANGGQASVTAQAKAIGFKGVGTYPAGSMHLDSRHGVFTTWSSFVPFHGRVKGADL